MCNLVDFEVCGEVIKVAEIKVRYLENIINLAKSCKLINKIILFGSCLEERCSESSDIDIAVFGSISEYKALTSSAYRKFHESIVGYDFNEDYDIIYFDESKEDNSEIMKNIQRGKVIYKM